MRQVHGTDPDTGLPRMGPVPVSAEIDASAPGVTAQLIRDYGFDPDRARRAVAIARDCELDNEPVPGGYVSIACTRRQDGAYEYALTPHTD